jgi:hypothetical protein
MRHHIQQRLPVRTLEGAVPACRSRLEAGHVRDVTNKKAVFGIARAPVAVGVGHDTRAPKARCCAERIPNPRRTVRPPVLPRPTTCRTGSTASVRLWKPMLLLPPLACLAASDRIESLVLVRSGIRIHVDLPVQLGIPKDAVAILVFVVGVVVVILRTRHLTGKVGKVHLLLPPTSTFAACAGRADGVRLLLRVPPPCRRRHEPAACCVVGRRRWHKSCCCCCSDDVLERIGSWQCAIWTRPPPPPARAARPTAATGGGPMAPRAAATVSATAERMPPRRQGPEASLLLPLLRSFRIGVRFVVRRMRSAAAALEPAVIDLGVRTYRRRPTRRRDIR